MSVATSTTLATAGCCAPRVGAASRAASRQAAATPARAALLVALAIVSSDVAFARAAVARADGSSTVFVPADDAVAGSRRALFGADDDAPPSPASSNPPLPAWPPAPPLPLLVVLGLLPP